VQRIAARTVSIHLQKDCNHTFLIPAASGKGSREAEAARFRKRLRQRHSSLNAENSALKKLASVIMSAAKNLSFLQSGRRKRDSSGQNPARSMTS
jgi:hypothetical protein